MSSPIISKEVSPVVKNLPQRKHKTQMVLQKISTQLIRMRSWTRGVPTTSKFIMVITGMENCLLTPFMNIGEKILDKSLAKQVQLCTKKIKLHHNQVYFAL